ncbi:hypothetical protein SUGI_0454270 [Cryptomeria japonica]|nr:hypothetical protein SUGI_0454270 [Cryptomeria japonica]
MHTICIPNMQSQYAYQNKVWDLIEDFDAFDIQLVPRKVNGIPDALVVVASTLEPLSQSPLKKFSKELICIPIVPNNIKHFQVFQDDAHILAFLANSGAFVEQIVDVEDKMDDLNIESNVDIVDLPTNVIPKGMVTLERLFDSDPRVKERLTMDSDAKNYEPHNIGLEGQERIVYIGKICTQIEREKLIQILKELIDVIAWGYEDLKIFDTMIITHVIPLKPNIKSFWQKQCPVNALIEPLIFKEVQKLLSTKIIFLVRHSTWVANLVPVRKKNGEIQLCVNFRNLNKASEKDNYPLPSLDKVLQIANGSQMMSFLDGYSGYNQVLVNYEDRMKTTFTMKWGTYAYKRMPFGLINAGATFQRVMDMDFKELIGKCIIIYMNDLMIFSKVREDHPDHLQKVLERCVGDMGFPLTPRNVCLDWLKESYLAT